MGDWNEDDNWRDGPAGTKPGSDDTTIIPSGKTCEVENASQSIETLDVQGTLLIKGKNLTIFPDGSTDQTVDGTIGFLKPGSTTPRLRIDGDADFAGTGVISASDGSSHDPALIVSTDINTNRVLTIDAGVNLEGSFTVQVDLVLDGTAVVDDADDTMVLGVENGSPPVGVRWNVSGTGEFEISAGVLLFTSNAYWGGPSSPGPQPDVEISSTGIWRFDDANPFEGPGFCHDIDSVITLSNSGSIEVLDPSSDPASSGFLPVGFDSAITLGATTSFIIDAEVDIDANLKVGGGTLDLSGDLLTLVGNLQVTAGDVIIDTGGDLVQSGGTVAFTGGEVELDGAGSSIIVDPNSGDADFDGTIFTFTGGGTLKVIDDATGLIDVPADLNGLIHVTGDLKAAIEIDGDFASGGRILVDGDMIDSAADLSGGHIIVNGSLVNGSLKEIVIAGAFAGDTEFISIDYDGWDSGDEWASGAQIEVDSTTYSGNTPAAQIWEITQYRADMNNDGAVDSEDIDGFWTGLGNPGQYALDYPGLGGPSMVWHGDCNEDGDFDSEDIDPFFDCVKFGGCGFYLSAQEVAALIDEHVRPAKLADVVDLLDDYSRNGRRTEVRGFWSAVVAILRQS